MFFFLSLKKQKHPSGHTFIDILKIDIVGGEFDALTAFLDQRARDGLELLPIGQLQIEIHAREGHERFDYFARWWESLKVAGLRPFWTELNMVYVNFMRGVRPELAEVCICLSPFFGRLARTRGICFEPVADRVFFLGLHKTVLVY